jgi:oligoendopeptidase F
LKASTRVLKEHINTFGATYNACVKSAVVNAQVRHYASSRAMSMADEHVPEQVYDDLVKTGEKVYARDVPLRAFEKENIRLR